MDILMTGVERAPNFGLKRTPMIKNGRQIRAARTYMGWHQTELANRATLSVATIKQIEGDEVDPRMSTINAIERAFREAGLVFIDDGEVSAGGGAGFRMAREGEPKTGGTRPTRRIRAPGTKRRTQ